MQHDLENESDKTTLLFFLDGLFKMWMDCFFCFCEMDC